MPKRSESAVICIVGRLDDQGAVDRPVSAADRPVSANWPISTDRPVWVDCLPVWVDCLAVSCVVWRTRMECSLGEESSARSSALRRCGPTSRSSPASVAALMASIRDGELARRNRCAVRWLRLDGPLRILGAPEMLGAVIRCFLGDRNVMGVTLSDTGRRHLNKPRIPAQFFNGPRAAISHAGT